MIHTVKAFGIVNKADIFLELSCFYDPKDVGNLISGSSAFSGFPDSSVDKESACSAGDPSSIPGSGRLPTPVFLGFPVAQLAKNPAARRETGVQSLGWEDPLDKGKAAHSSILAWRILWTLYSMGLQRVGHN